MWPGKVRQCKKAEQIEAKQGSNAKQSEATPINAINAQRKAKQHRAKPGQTKKTAT